MKPVPMYDIHGRPLKVVWPLPEKAAMPDQADDETPQGVAHRKATVTTIIPPKETPVNKAAALILIVICILALLCGFLVIQAATPAVEPLAQPLYLPWLEPFAIPCVILCVVGIIAIAIVTRKRD